MARTTTKPRVLLLSATSIFGGGEVYYIKLVKLLLERYELAAVAFNPKLQSEFENMGIRVWRGEFSPTSSLLSRYTIAAKCLLKALRDYRPRLVHLNGGSETFLDLIPRVLGIPVLITYHTYTNASEAFHKRLLRALCFRLAKKVICVSTTVRDNLHDILWTSNTVVIPNWVDFACEGGHRATFDGSRAISLLFVGRIEIAKGIFDLLQAMKHLDGVHLDIVGEGSCMSRAMDESVNLSVTFHGFQENVASFYRNADLFVLPSHSEGHPLVLIEAMSCGVPCLTSNIPAAIETAGNGQFALTYRCGDPCDLAEKIRCLQKNPSSLISLSEDGQRYALTAYSEERIRPMYFNLFRSVLEA